MKMKMKRQIPFDFVLQELEKGAPRIKPMFGAYAVYLGERIVFILSDRARIEADRGVWIATLGEHHASLQNIFPSMRSIEMFGPGPTQWQVLPQDSHDFEQSVLLACELALGGDPRIGKIPKTRPLRKKLAEKPVKKVKRRATKKQVRKVKRRLVKKRLSK